MSGRRTMPEIDREKVRAQIRRLDGTGLLVWLDRAIDMLPDEAFPELVADYVHLRDIVSDGRTRPDLLHTVRRFHRESMSGRYYQDFDVNSRNFMEKSRGTENFIAEHSRLLDACMRAERAGDLETAGEGLGLLIDLLRQVDRCEIDIIFFADEAGSWQVGVDWVEVLPAWFRSLSPGTDPKQGPEVDPSRVYRRAAGSGTGGCKGVAPLAGKTDPKQGPKADPSRVCRRAAGSGTGGCKGVAPLAGKTDPYDWAETVTDALNNFAMHEMDTILTAASDIATPRQRQALSEYECNLRRRR